MAPDLAEEERRAREALAGDVWDYLAGGADDELTLADNLAAWGRVRLRPRVLRDVSRVSTATMVLSSPVDVPILVAPVAFQRLAHAEGEVAMARAAARAGTLMVVSTRSSMALEEVAAAAGGRWWFQVYVLADRGWTDELVARAVAAGGCQALVLTGDTPVLGNRRRDALNQFRLPPGVAMANLASGPEGPEATTPEALQSRAVTFDDIERLASSSGLPVVVKGVLRGDDAVSCLEAGAAAIVVSNHGGRQLDGAVATARALPEVVHAVAGRAEVYVDGGIRQGRDVLAAVALGARAVLVGRPPVWGLANGGAPGAERVLKVLATELVLAMALAGAADLAALTPDLVAPA